MVICILTGTADGKLTSARNFESSNCQEDYNIQETIWVLQKRLNPVNMYMSRPRSESGPILNWSRPEPNSDLGRPKSQF